MTALIFELMRKRMRNGFSTLLPAEDAVWVFRYKLDMSQISALPQEHHWKHLIINLSVKPNQITPTFNETMDMEVAPDSINFGHSFPHILQSIWEVDPDQSLVRVSTLDLTDAYHRGTLRTSQL